MGSTERRLGLEDLPGCLALSAAAGWNQNAADWRLMLGFGRGWGIALEDGTLAASTLVLPYDGFAWVAMVLVLPQHRKKGFATTLLRTSISFLRKNNKTPILDATPAGREVYAREGFRDTWGFKRFSLSQAFSLEGTNARPVLASDWPRILELDRQAFGASRESVLRDLASRLPHAAHVAESGGKLAGFVLGRDGREARQIGPLVARDGETAKDLFAAALARTEPPVYADMLDRDPVLSAWIESLGFAFQRPFTRMVHGAARAPGDAGLVFCPAGPELG
ncbi:MAG: GNAT family N-acetyltransferase [Pseudomonadota bacterium]